VARGWYGWETMTAAEKSPPGPADASARPRRSGAVWLGVALALIGLLVMVVGLSLVYFYADRFVRPTAVATPPAPVPPPVPVAPAPGARREP
jgi:hypothetical protein